MCISCFEVSFSSGYMTNADSYIYFSMQGSSCQSLEIENGPYVGHSFGELIPKGKSQIVHPFPLNFQWVLSYSGLYANSYFESCNQNQLCKK